MNRNSEYRDASGLRIRCLSRELHVTVILSEKGEGTFKTYRLMEPCLQITPVVSR